MAKAVDLPLWLMEALPEMEQPHHLSMGEGGVHLLTAPDGTVEEFPDLAALHQAFRGDFTIGDDVYEFHGEDPKNGFGLTAPAGRGLVSWIHSHTDKDRLGILLSDYQQSLECSERYEVNPTDFVTAYQFVDSHPAYWYTPYGGWHWETSGHCGRVYQMVMVDKSTGKHTIALETGGHVPEPAGENAVPYSTHYHDYRLDVYAPTFEEAYIQLAELTHKFFYPDGTERPEVEHDKPQWVEEVEAAVDSFHAEQAAYDAEEAASSVQEEKP